ncbi:MAG: DUF6691 family protein [Polyangiaceae bacterium]
MKATRGAVAFGAGLVFAVGLGVAGMTRPSKVLAFLDVSGSWDPSLAVVMASALAMHAPISWWARRRGRPVFDRKLWLPERTQLDLPLVLGAILFGIGWGLAGYCPGPAIVTAASGATEALWFTAAMLGSMGLYAVASRLARPAASTSDCATLSG